MNLNHEFVNMKKIEVTLKLLIILLRKVDFHYYQQQA